MADQGFPGFQQPNTGGQDFNSLWFVISQALSVRSTIKLVKVQAVHGDGIATPLTVDILSMVTQIDGNGTAKPHGTVYGVPVFVFQGGITACIMVPAVGDIGAALFCDRDISTVKQTGKVSLPGSRRQMDWADGLYLGGYLNPAATQYLIGKSDGLHLVSPTKIFFDTPSAEFSGDVIVDGKLSSGDTTSLAGGAKKVVLDGDPVSGGVVRASSTKTTGT